MVDARSDREKRKTKFMQEMCLAIAYNGSANNPIFSHSASQLALRTSAIFEEIERCAADKKHGAGT